MYMTYAVLVEDYVCNFERFREGEIKLAHTWVVGIWDGFGTWKVQFLGSALDLEATMLSQTPRGTQKSKPSESLFST